jgi:alkanesulfonate monooxygenase
MSAPSSSLSTSGVVPAVNSRIDIFSTSPQSLGADRNTYRQQTINVARWSEEAGCTGILVYTDNGIVDPWLVSEVILAATSRLCPLVAVQPVYMHPYTVAKMVASLAFLYGRRIFLNMVAGGFTNDLTALHDTTPHDKRYARLQEYTHIIKHLLSGETVTFAGEFYTVDKLSLKPAVPRELIPDILMSGSSEAGLAAAQALDAIAVRYPGPVADYAAEARPADGRQGIRVGIIARQDEDEAWEVANKRFPPDRKGEMLHELAMKVSDSSWHRHLSRLGAAATESRPPYWLRPFETSKTNCPYLVGTYDAVASQLSAYFTAGFTTFILDIPPNQEELGHIGTVFERALHRPFAGENA